MKVAISGGFDPIHKGHIQLIREAKKLGDELIVIANNDNWLTKKKGKPFMPEDERKIILEEMRSVDKVILTNHKPDDPDVSVCNELRQVKPDLFANGGDRKEDNIPEYQLCDELGIKMVFNVGGGKIQSSSWLISANR